MNALRRMTRFTRPYGWTIVIGLFTVILPVAMELVVPRMLQVVIDQGIRAGDMDAIWRGSVVMLVSAGIGAIATLVQGVCRAQLSQGIAFDLRNELFAHVQKLSFANLDQMQTGQLMTRLSSDVDVVRMFLSAAISLMLRALLMIAGSVAMLVLIDWQLSLIVIGLLAVAGVILRVLMQRATPLFNLVQEKLSALNTIVQENLAGVQVVKAFVRERFEIERFGASNIEYLAENVKVGRLLAVALPLLTVLTNLGLVAILWFGGVSVIGERLSVGELVAFTNYLLIGTAPLLLLSNMLTMVSRAEASAVRIAEVLDTHPRIQPAPEPYAAGSMAGRVAFEHVAFHYNGGEQEPEGGFHREPFSPNGARAPEEERDVLEDVSLTALPGQRIALLGATGSGKSTLVSLIPRFYDVTAGRVTVDGVDVRDWAPEDLRGQMGIALQDTILFNGTIRENIAYGRPAASMPEVVAAAQAAQAHDFIMAMEDGYDSRVEERGANLSGGQRQRIAIARALLVNPRILILDDSTSAVDMETEIRIQEALEEWMAGRTTFVVAQRINSVLNADQILILDAGRVVAQGNHRDLLATSPIYQEIYRSQVGAESSAQDGVNP